MADTMSSTRPRSHRIGHGPLLAPPAGRADAVGCFDSVTIDEAGGGAVLRLVGWAASDAAGPADGFEVRLGGEGLPGLTVESGLGSPDVAGIYPHLAEADRCRFRVAVPLTAGQRARARGAVISCTPHFGGRPGCTLARIVEPTIAPASQADSNYVGSGDFLSVSNEFLGHLMHKCGLRPEHDVLDAGCGLGRIAYSLAHYLAPTARYEGFDIVGDLIGWAQRTIGSQRPNFRFQKVDVYNKWYNPTGPVPSTGLRFPYDDESFDVIFLTSVFTHMLGDEIRHYLDEIRRVLKPGGRCLATCFLRTPESIALIEQGRSHFHLVHPVGDGYTSNPEVPEDAIGFDEPEFLGWVGSRGLAVAEKYDGSWCGRPVTVSFQDILILRKA